MNALATQQTSRTTFASSKAVWALLAITALHTVIQPVAALGAAIAANGVYSASIQEPSDGNQVGSWSAKTESANPVGANRNLLYKATGGQRRQNFSSLRIFNPGGSSTDYTFGGRNGGVNLDSSVVAQTSVSPGHHQTIWDLTAESLEIQQDVRVIGSQYSDSAIYHTVEITNAGNTTKHLGWRNLYDWTLNDPSFDDGPANSVESCSGTVIAGTPFEFDHSPNRGEYVRVTSRPAPSSGPSYEVLLMLGENPSFTALPVTTPTRYTFAHWWGAVATTFDYTHGGRNVADGNGDSAGVSWFGHDLASAIELAPGESTRIAQMLTAVPPGQCPGRVPEPSSAAISLLLIGGLAVHKRRI